MIFSVAALYKSLKKIILQNERWEDRQDRDFCVYILLVLFKRKLIESIHIFCTDIFYYRLSMQETKILEIW